MRTRSIVVFSPFNTMPFGEHCLTQDWITTRLDIFAQYTLRSLRAQTSQAFHALIAHDDASDDVVAASLRDRPPLPDNVEFVPRRRFAGRVVELADGADDIFLLRIDSDDMYHVEFVERLAEHPVHDDTQAIVNQHGYLFDAARHLLSPWYHVSPPFYCLRYHTRAFEAGHRIRLPNGHPDAVKLSHQTMPGYNFVQVVHHANTSTRFPRSGPVISDAHEVDGILSRYRG